jgi:hypothetical protein
MQLVLAGLQCSPTFEVQSDVASSLHAFCEFIHEKLKRAPTEKSLFLR